MGSVLYMPNVLSLPFLVTCIAVMWLFELGLGGWR